MVTCAPTACRQKVSDSISLPSRGSFHLSLTVLSTIGHRVVFRLGGWAPLLQTGLHVSGPTLVPPWGSNHFVYRDFTFCVRPFRNRSTMITFSRYWRPATPADKSAGLASFPFARRYLENRCFFLFLGLLRCFSSPRSLLTGYVFTCGYLHITVGEFPHSEIRGSMDMCSSPRLIAACHVLLRLPVPRHPPYALIRLTFCKTGSFFSRLLS